ncbi:MAG: ATP-binding protein [Elusimicrobia bacterium]|nr:ATP-binding protein [Elusimicrobiota bacterium]
MTKSLELTRCLPLADLLAKKSYFLFGPRQTGKTHLIQKSLPKTRVYDLLDGATLAALSQNPGRIEQELAPQDQWVVIDEVQRLPELLNEVHRLIEKRKLHFLMTGSSARKLCRTGVNLLGGRARTKYLHPLSATELGNHFDLNRALSIGLIPSIYLSDDPPADLEAYTGTYLKEEIMAEGAVRNLPAFSRFVHVAALCNATVVNFTNVANDAQVKRTTVYEYFEILRDTLILRELPAWREGRSRKPRVSSKYYFFDTGVAHHLQGRDVHPGTSEFGAAFETYILHELTCRQDYNGLPPLSFWSSASGLEVDFLIGDQIALEVKAKTNVSPHDLRSLHAIKEEGVFRRLICVSLEPHSRKVEGIDILPLSDFLKALWSGDFS